MKLLATGNRLQKKVKTPAVWKSTVKRHVATCGHHCVHVDDVLPLRMQNSIRRKACLICYGMLCGGLLLKCWCAYAADVWLQMTSIYATPKTRKQILHKHYLLNSTSFRDLVGLAADFSWWSVVKCGRNRNHGDDCSLHIKWGVILNWIQK